MNRRKFLKSVALGAGVASWPLWLKSAFAADKCTELEAPARGMVAVADGYRAAVRAKKPLFVIVIPANDGAKWERGVRWGELLNHGTDAQLAPLGLAEVACASMSDLRKIVPTAIEGEPTMIVVDTTGTPAKTRAVSVDFEAVRDRWDLAGSSWEEVQRMQDETILRNIARLADGIRTALLADGVVTHVPADQVLADKALAAEVRSRLCVQAPRGSHWALSTGCGVDIEGEDNELMMACGMGHSPEKSRRFLYLFAQTPGERFRDSLRRREQGENESDDVQEVFE